MSEFWKKVLTPAHITSLLIIVGVIILLIIARIILNSYKNKHKNVISTRKNAANAAYNIVRAVILVSAVIAIMQVNGINVTSLVTGLGIASVVVGLAVQDPLRDLINGIRMSTDHFFSVGDVIEFQGIEGVVKYMSLRTTKIEHLETKMIYVISNRDIAEVKRLSTVFDLDLPLSYNEDFNRVHAILTDTAKKIEELEKVSKCEYKGTEKFGESSILYKTRIHCSPRDKYEVNRAAMKIIQTALDENDIHIPFNQLDVHCNIIEK